MGFSGDWGAVLLAAVVRFHVQRVRALAPVSILAADLRERVVLVRERDRVASRQRAEAEPVGADIGAGVLDELDEFHPDRMASRILGMGDVLSLIERVESEMDQKKAEEAARKLEENRFDMNDLLEQFRQIKKMGSLKNLL